MATTARRSIRDRNKAAIAHDADASPDPVDEPVEPAAVDVPAAAPAAERPRTSTTTSKTAGKTKYPPKVSFYQDPADTDRMRAALLHTMATENYRNLSQFVSEAVMEKVARLEKAYNNGEPFGSVGARELPQGRPMGE